MLFASREKSARNTARLPCRQHCHAAQMAFASTDYSTGERANDFVSGRRRDENRHRLEPPRQCLGCQNSVSKAVKI